MNRLIFVMIDTVVERVAYWICKNPRLQKVKTYTFIFSVGVKALCYKPEGRGFDSR
jgi:hypothetical protein